MDSPTGVQLIRKAFIQSAVILLMPIVVPSVDSIGLTLQTNVLAYTFGNGFYNIDYSINAALLMCLGLAVVSFPTWVRRIVNVWSWLPLIRLTGSGVPVPTNYGPFIYMT